jgi:hypothetical protein
VNLDITTEVVGDLMGEGESQACTIGARRALGPVETVEDVGYLGFQDAATAVRYADNDPPILE